MISLQALCLAVTGLAFWAEKHPDASAEQLADIFVESVEREDEQMELRRRLQMEDQSEISLEEFKRKMAR